MKITPPRPAFYTDRELAAFWEIEHYLVIRYITTGELKAEKKTVTRPIGGGISWVTQQPVKSREQILRVWYEITLAEAERFEAEHPPTTATPELSTADPSPIPAAPEPGSIKATTEKIQRSDSLKKILIEITNDFKTHHKRTPTSNEVMNKVKALCKSRKHAVIQEVIENKIYWKSSKGIDKITTYHQLQNRLTGINAV